MLKLIIKHLTRVSSTEMGDEVKKLESWSGDWGLPSIDYNCLAIEVYKKLFTVLSWRIYVQATFNSWNIHMEDRRKFELYTGFFYILQAYCRFSGIPLKVTQGNNPLKSPSGITKCLKFRSIFPDLQVFD